MCTIGAGDTSHRWMNIVCMFYSQSSKVVKTLYPQNNSNEQEKRGDDVSQDIQCLPDEPDLL